MMSVRKFSIPNRNYYLLIAAIALIAYWPLSFHLFSLKNDALVYFLPWRYQISESIQNGYFPLWSPYLFNGMPLHEDIQSGVWNPVVMTISLFTKYNMSVFEWEMLAYIIIGGIGFFKLGRAFGFDKKICLSLASSYMCCGFIIDSGSIIPWVISAAYIPFVFCYFKRILSDSGSNNTIKLAFSLSLLFLAGYMSYFIVTGYILGFLLIAASINGKLKYEKTLPQLFLAGLITLIICGPALLSYLDYFPFYARGKGLSLDAAEFNPFTMRNTLSYVFPTASYKLETANDINSRNSYFGILPLLFIAFSFRKISRLHVLILVITLIFFLFSLGNAVPVRAFFFEYIPLFNTFRHPGNARIFTITGLLIFSGMGMQVYSEEGNRKQLARTIYVYLIIIAVILILQTLRERSENLFYLFTHLRSSTAIKNFLDQSTANTWIMICGLIQMIFLVVFALLRGKNFLWLTAAGISNVIVFTFLSMPFTLVSQHRTEEVNSFLHSFPPGFPQSEAWKKIDNPKNDSVGVTVYGYTKFYEKTMDFQGYVNNPTVSTFYQDFLQDASLRNNIVGHSFAYFTNSTPVALKKFTPNRFDLSINTEHEDTLQIIQQYHPNWKAEIDGKAVKITRAQTAFMQIIVPAGVHEICIHYQLPLLMKVSIVISMITIIGCIILPMRKTFLTYGKDK